MRNMYRPRIGSKSCDTNIQQEVDEDFRDKFVSDEAASAEHNGDIWSRKLTKYGANLTGKIVYFLLNISIEYRPQYMR